jgi:hypothetical protein
MKNVYNFFKEKNYNYIVFFFWWPRFEPRLVVAEVRTPDLAYIMHCPYQLS